MIHYVFLCSSVMLHAMQTRSLPLASFLVLLEILPAFSLYSHRADIRSKVSRTKPSLILDVTCRNRSVKSLVLLVRKRKVFFFLMRKIVKMVRFLVSISFYDYGPVFALKAPRVFEERTLVSRRAPRPWGEVAAQYPARSHGQGPVWWAQRPAGRIPQPMYAAVPQPGNKADSHTNILLIIQSQFNWGLWLAESVVALGSFVKEAGASSAGVQRRWCTVCSGTLSKSAVKICCVTTSTAGRVGRHWRQKHTRCREAGRHKYKVLGIWPTVLISRPSESLMFYVCLCMAQLASAWKTIYLLLSPCFLPQPGP